nr:hypothetical protein [Oceaniglobus ichthyenteri]
MDPKVLNHAFHGTDEVGKRAAGYTNLLTCFEISIRSKTPLLVTSQHPTGDNYTGNRAGDRRARTYQIIDSISFPYLISTGMGRVRSQKQIAAENRAHFLNHTTTPVPGGFMTGHENIKPTLFQLTKRNVPLIGTAQGQIPGRIHKIGRL